MVSIYISLQYSLTVCLHVLYKKYKYQHLYGTRKLPVNVHYVKL